MVRRSLRRDVPDKRTADLTADAAIAGVCQPAHILRERTRDARSNADQVLGANIAHNKRVG